MIQSLRSFLGIKELLEKGYFEFKAVGYVVEALQVAIGDDDIQEEAIIVTVTVHLPVGQIETFTGEADPDALR